MKAKGRRHSLASGNRADKDDTIPGWFADFSDNSTIHGLKYLGGRRRHWLERWFWVLSFFISVITAAILIHKSYVKWQSSPVIISFAENSTYIWQIPFPAVTICPETKATAEFISFTKAYNLVKARQTENLTQDELRNLDALAQVCDPHLLLNDSINSGLLPEEIAPLLKSITMSLNETTLYCKWQNEVDNCNKFFSVILTDEGFCYTFNILNVRELFKEEALARNFNYFHHDKNSTDWTLEDGYTKSEFETYPKRVLGAGIQDSFNIVLQLNETDLDYICRGPVQGFKIHLHNPSEFPRISKRYFRVPLKQEVVVSIKPNMITTLEGLYGYAPERRQCYFNHERNLTFFKVYTQSNCELECLANFTIRQCGCIKFSMPRNETTKICSQADVKCYNSVEHNLMLKDYEMRSLTGMTDCKCLPSCTSISYDAELSQAEFEFEKIYRAFNDNLDEISGSLLSRLTILYKEDQFTSLKRSELFGFSDFTADCGGLLGLFMGMSLLSLVEIAYYITLRLACNLDFRRSREIEVESTAQVKFSPTVDRENAIEHFIARRAPRETGSLYRKPISRTSKGSSYF